MHQLDHGLARIRAAGLVPLRRSEPLQPDRHFAQLDRVAVADVGNLPGQLFPGTLCRRGGPREHQEAGEQAEQAAVHDLLTTNAQVEDIDPSYTGATAMAIVPLLLPPAAKARALLHYLLEHGDVVGRDASAGP